jgi:hypothetical protein
MTKRDDKYGIGLIALLIAILFLQCNQSRRLQRDIQLEKEKVEREINNRAASEDSLRLVKLENGNLATTIRSYEFDIKHLKDSEKELLKKYEDLTTGYKKLKGINSLIKADLELTESILAETQAMLINDTTVALTFSKYDLFSEGNTRLISGKSMLSISQLDQPKLIDTEISLDQSIRLKALIDDLEDGPSLVISTDYPGITISDIENINLINSKLRAKEIDDYVSNSSSLALGIGVGYGLNYVGQGNFRPGPTIGIGLYWSPKKLRFK